MRPFPMKRIGASLVLLMVSGCAHVISSDIRSQARRDATFPMILRNPAAYVGSTVILGGVIIDTRNNPDGTELVVLETPLDYQGMPRDKEYSRGRFIARVSQYLDPEIYKKDRKMTLAGEVVGMESRPLGEISYDYPVLRVRELHLWREVTRYYYRRPPYYRSPYWYGYPYWPYYRFHYYGPW